MNANNSDDFTRLIKLSQKLIHLPKSGKLHFTYILRKKKIISMGVNVTFKTHPMAKKYQHRFFSQHSELNAILNFPFKYRTLCNYKIVNIRIRQDGSLASSKPCKACALLLKDMGFKKIFFSTNSTFSELIL